MMTIWKMRNKYYAMQWFFDGVDDKGRRCARYFWFPTRSERDSWVEMGAPYRGPGYREPVAGRDSELRRLYWRERHRGERGVWIERI